MGKYFKVSESVYHKNYYTITFLDEFYNYIGYSDGSYNVYKARLFGLDYGDYLRMARDNYNAILIGKNQKYPIELFAAKEDGEKLVKELEDRMEYIVSVCWNNLTHLQREETEFNI